MTLSPVEPVEELLIEWVTPSLTLKRGRDPLGLQTITLDRVMPRLLPGVLALSQRARYLTIYPFLLSLYEERRLAAETPRLVNSSACASMSFAWRCNCVRATAAQPTP